MSPALVIGHPTTLVVSVILIPVILAIAVFLPGNEFLPLASLAGMFYLFPLILPFTKGNVVKTLIIGLIALIIGLYFVTDMAPDFTMAADQVYKATGIMPPISLTDSREVHSTSPIPLRLADLPWCQVAVCRYGFALCRYHHPDGGQQPQNREGREKNEE